MTTSPRNTRSSSQARAVLRGRADLAPLRRARALSVACALAVAALCALGCDSRQAPQDAAEAAATAPRKSVTVVDSAGREVEVKQPVGRVVVLNARAAEMMRAIGAADRIVAINSTMKERDAAFWPELSHLPAVGSAFEPNMEIIAELRPELVIAYAMRPGSTFDEQMAKFGIPTLRLDCYWPDEVVDDALLLGRVFGEEENARQLVAFIEKWRALIEERIAEVAPEERPAVFVESYGELRGAGTGTAGHSMCVLAGGRNIVEELGARNPTVSSEWILERNPFAIVKAVSASAGGYGADDAKGMRSVREEIMARTGWRNLSAVREGRVYLVSSNVWLGPSHVAAQARLAKWFYPERFADIEPKDILKEYIETFHGLTDTGEPFYP